LRDPDLAALIGTATRRAFVRLIDLCLEERVDALLLAGDLYDGDQTSMKTARFLAEQLGRLDAAGIRSFIIRGNHDACSRITRELVYPESVTLFRDRAGAVTIERGAGVMPLVIHGLSFARPQVPESLLSQYQPPVPGAINLGLMHTSLAGAAGHDPYAPCALVDLQRSGFRYWALGHIHKRFVVEGACMVVMPGIPQGRDINEAGPKSVSLGTIHDSGAITLEERGTSLAQFERLTVDLDGITVWRDLVAVVGRALEQVRNGIVSDHLVARLHLGGTTPLAWRLRRDLDQLLTEARQYGAGLGKCWVESIETTCRQPQAEAETLETTDPLMELRRLIEQDVVLSDAFQHDLITLAGEIQRKLPVECRDVFGKDEASFQTELVRLAREGIDDVFARLQDGAGNGES